MVRVCCGLGLRARRTNHERVTLAYEIVATIRGVLMTSYRPRVNCVLGFGANHRERGSDAPVFGLTWRGCVCNGQSLLRIEVENTKDKSRTCDGCIRDRRDDPRCVDDAISPPRQLCARLRRERAARLDGARAVVRGRLKVHQVAMQ